MRNATISIDSVETTFTDDRIVKSNISVYPRTMVFRVDPVENQQKLFIGHIEYTEDFQNINYNNNSLLFIRTVTFVDNELSYGLPYHRYIDGVDGNDYHLCSLYIPPGTYNTVGEIVDALNLVMEESLNSLFDVITTTVTSYEGSLVDDTNLVSSAGTLTIKSASLDAVTLTPPPWTNKVWYRIETIDYTTTSDIATIATGDLICFDKCTDLTSLMEATIECVTFYKNKYTNYVNTTVEDGTTNTFVGVVDSRILSAGLQTTTVYPNKLKEFKVYGVQTNVSVIRKGDIPPIPQINNQPIMLNYLHVVPVMSKLDAAGGWESWGVLHGIELVLRTELVTTPAMEGNASYQSIKVVTGNIVIYGLASGGADPPLRVYTGRIITDNNVLGTNAMGIVPCDPMSGMEYDRLNEKVGTFRFVFLNRDISGDVRVPWLMDYTPQYFNTITEINISQYTDSVVNVYTPDTWSIAWKTNEALVGHGVVRDWKEAISGETYCFRNSQQIGSDRTGNQYEGLFVINTLMEQLTVSNATVDHGELTSSSNNLSAITNIYSGTEGIYVSRAARANEELFHDSGLYTMFKTLIGNRKIFTYSDAGISSAIPIIPVQYHTKMSRTENFMDEYKPEGCLTKIMPTILEKYGGTVSTTTNLELLSTFYEENDSVNSFYSLFMEDGCLWKVMGIIPLQVFTNTIKLNRSGNIDVQANEFETPVWLIKGTQYTEEFYNGTITTTKKYNIRYTSGNIYYNLVVGAGIDISQDNNSVLFENTFHQRDYIADLALPSKLSAYVSVSDDIESILNNNSLEFFDSRSVYESQPTNGMTVSGRIDINLTLDITNNPYYIYVVAPNSRYPLRNINGKLYIIRITN